MDNIGYCGPSFNPQLLGYDPLRVADYFGEQWPMRAADFLAWREFFYPGEILCNRCAIQRVRCDIYLNNQDKCTRCQALGVDCTIAVEEGAPPIYQDPAEEMDLEELIDPRLLADGGDIVDNPSLFQDLGSDAGGHISPGPNDDALHDPAEASLLGASLLGASMDIDSPPSDHPDVSIYPSPPPPPGSEIPSISDNVQRFAQGDPQASQALQNPQPLTQAPQVPVPQVPVPQVTVPQNPQPSTQAPQPLTQVPQNAQAPAPARSREPYTPQRILQENLPTSRGLKRTICDLCNANSALKCNWELDRQNGTHEGCSRCKEYGVICVVNGIAFPPRRDAGPKAYNMLRSCVECVTNSTTCDRARPCEACFARGDPCTFTNHERARWGTFPRGAAVGTETYPYTSSVGGGLTGVTDPNFKFSEPIPQPHNFHTEYVRWLEGGVFPVPLGYNRPNPSPTRPNHRLQLLTFGPPPAAPSLSNPTGAPPGAATGPSNPMPPTVAGPSNPMPPTVAGPSNPMPPTVAGPSSFIVPQAPANPALAGSGSGSGLGFGSRPVIIPPGVEQNEVMQLTRGALTIFSVTDDSDLIQPPSPGPKVPPFPPHGMQMFGNAPPPHPNPSATPALQKITYNSIMDPSMNESMPCMEVREGGVCGRPTSLVCEDLSHGHQALPVCQECHDESRLRIEQALAPNAAFLRAYACSACAERVISDPATIEDERFNIWGLPPNVFDHVADANRSRSCGVPLRLTGCNCATKLIDRVLCTPHRVEHFLDLRTRVRSMIDYVNDCLSRNACPCCFANDGANSQGFRDEHGNPHQHVAFECLSCLGIVVTDPATHATLGGPPVPPA